VHGNTCIQKQSECPHHKNSLVNSSAVNNLASSLAQSDGPAEIEGNICGGQLENSSSINNNNLDSPTGSFSPNSGKAAFHNNNNNLKISENHLSTKLLRTKSSPYSKPDQVESRVSASTSDGFISSNNGVGSQPVVVNSENNNSPVSGGLLCTNSGGVDDSDSVNNNMVIRRETNGNNIEIKMIDSHFQGNGGGNGETCCIGLANHPHIHNNLQQQQQMHSIHTRNPGVIVSTDMDTCSGMVDNKDSFGHDNLNFVRNHSLLGNCGGSLSLGLNCGGALNANDNAIQGATSPGSSSYEDRDCDDDK